MVRAAVCVYIGAGMSLSIYTNPDSRVKLSRQEVYSSFYKVLTWRRQYDCRRRETSLPLKIRQLDLIMGPHSSSEHRLEVRERMLLRRNGGII